MNLSSSITKLAALTATVSACNASTPERPTNISVASPEEIVSHLLDRRKALKQNIDEVCRGSYNCWRGTEGTLMNLDDTSAFACNPAIEDPNPANHTGLMVNPSINIEDTDTFSSIEAKVQECRIRISLPVLYPLAQKISACYSTIELECASQTQTIVTDREYTQLWK